MSKKTNDFDLKHTFGILLVDEEINHDRRVLNSLKSYQNVHVINCRDLYKITQVLSINAYINIFYILVIGFIKGFWLSRNIRQFYRFRFNSFAGSVIASLRNAFQAYKIVVEPNSKPDDVVLIHAHDLYCGVIGAKLAKRLGTKFIYDAHEVEFHRNRKNSWLRSAFDWSVEKHVIQAADEIRVVNTKIAELYCLVYPGIDSRVRGVSNDHFAPHPVDIESISNSEHATIVYVGQGVKGRQLEQLALFTKDSELSVHAFFIGEVPTFAVNAQWIIGPRDYENDLVSLVQSQRCMMWCCVENICLSYQLALPNKFFQALAVGMPVIVSRDTYLSEIVHKYKIGIVLDDHDSNWILNQIKSKEFVEWVGNILRLRNDLSKGLVVL